jgi:glycosyltransferase involved in cell wall biosynthesis
MGRHSRVGRVIDVVLPVLDEEEALPHVLGRFGPGWRPIVVDNGSTDGSARVAAEHGALVVSEPRRGFGAACFAGLTAAESDIVCFMDADGSLDPGDLHLVTDPIDLAGTPRLVLGARRPEAGAWHPHARVANAVLALELRRRSGRPRDGPGPMRAAPRRRLLDLGIADRRFGWPLEMVLRAAAAGWDVQEVRVPYGRRTGGKSKVTGTVRGTARTVKDMLGVLRDVDRRVAADAARGS